VDAAARLLRERGPEGTSISDVMGEAGLTNGAFYAHFPSKKALLIEAMHRAIDLEQEPYRTLASLPPGREWLDLLAHAYLSRTHRDMDDAGCPIPRIASDLGRADAETREAFEADLRKMATYLADGLGDVDDFPTEKRALATMALCVGGLALARAVPDEAFSDEILQACRDFARRTVPPEQETE